LETIFDDINAERLSDFKDNPILPYLVAFTSGYEFDWSAADEIVNAVVLYDEETIIRYSHQLAQISHVLANARYFRQITRARTPIESWLKPHEMDLILRLITIMNMNRT
jgi:hypothetical protein